MFALYWGVPGSVGSVSLERHEIARADAEKLEATHKIDRLRESIHALVQALDRNRELQQKMQSRLKAIEVNLAKVGAQEQKIDQQSAEVKQQLVDLQAQHTQLLSEINTQRDYLLEDVRTQFVLGQQGLLKSILNQNDHASAQRAVLFHQYVTKVRTERIEYIETHIPTVEKLSGDIKKRQQELNELSAKVEKQRKEYQLARDQRQALLVIMQREIKGQQQQINDLRREESELLKVIGLLKESPESLAPLGKAIQEFSLLRGKLAWPTQGRIQHPFGQRDLITTRRSTGVVIAAKYGAAVHAVSHGRVAFADWIRGYGLIVILDHGSHYLSLYGHNQSLAKVVGDWVEPGELIARVGDTGGKDKATLYFEIRKNGVPINPSPWFRSDKP